MNAQDRKWMRFAAVLFAAGSAMSWHALALKPQAEAASGFSLPPSVLQGLTWPQRFELAGPEPASFGFAVTQPGLIRVEVQAQGAPVRVALVGARQLERAGTGRIVLELAVTAQDIQEEVLWQVRVLLAKPPLSKAPIQAGGSISVKHPPADAKVVQAQLLARDSHVRAARQQAEPKVRSQIDAFMQKGRAQMAKQHDDLRLAAEARAKPRLEQIRLQGQVGTRGAIAEATTVKQSGSVAVAGQQTLRTMQGPPPPTITRADASGLPRQMMLME